MKSILLIAVLFINTIKLSATSLLQVPPPPPPEPNAGGIGGNSAPIDQYIVLLFVCALVYVTYLFFNKRKAFK